MTLLPDCSPRRSLCLGCMWPGHFLLELRVASSRRTGRLTKEAEVQYMLLSIPRAPRALFCFCPEGRGPPLHRLSAQEPAPTGPQPPPRGTVLVPRKDEEARPEDFGESEAEQPGSSRLSSLLSKLMKAEWVSICHMLFNLPRKDGIKEVSPTHCSKLSMNITYRNPLQTLLNARYKHTGPLYSTLTQVIAPPSHCLWPRL
ncbi:uncharacterized protein LOC123581539 [Leopardus geoffroyi]|uniref:uncharacterized protein LOC123581539 n=1 Tax=Leopardus geoffroyi TaxID=46844 RepID=UPI001E265A7D|nr:uncharacterized protein LOC123581539 [Leopardus geoffroyi]